MRNTFATIIIFSLFIAGCGQQETANKPAQNHEQQAPHVQITVNTPDEALAELKKGNQRFLEGKLIYTDYPEQIDHTKSSQHPHTVILSCIDSRVPPEIIFDQGIGNIFVARVAGNLEDPNILGSMEYATKVVGSKLIVVMGHSNCGAVKGAIDNAEFGNLTQLVDRIKPAIAGDPSDMKHMMDETAKNNVKLTIQNILANSSIIRDLVNEKKVKIVGAYYDVATGEVSFMEE